MTIRIHCSAMRTCLQISKNLKLVHCVTSAENNVFPLSVKIMGVIYFAAVADHLVASQLVAKW